MVQQSALALRSGPSDSGVSELVRQLDSVLLGKHEQVMLSVACLIARGHLLVEDRPGVGKTTLAQAIGQSLGLEWQRLQFTNDLLPADITGVSIFNQVTTNFEFRPGPVFTPILLADEINRAPPRAQSALLEAMEEGQVTVDATTYPLGDQFFVIATQNPADQSGAYPLPDSQLDRFLAAIELGLPHADVEKQLLLNGGQRTRTSELEAVCDTRSLELWQNAAAAVHLSESVADYVLALLQATRTAVNSPSSPGSAGGLSPRAGLNLVKMSRAWAWLQGRDMVLPDDVQAVFPSVAAHRLTGSVGTGKPVAEKILDSVALN